MADEPTLPPTEDAAPVSPVEPEIEKSSKKVWLIILAVLVGLLLIGGGLFFGNRALYRSTFDQLVDATEQAEGDPVWTSYFVALDCFVNSVIQEQDLEMARADALTMAEETRLLGDHVATSLQAFEDLPVRVFQPRLVTARNAIHAHYQVWDDHLSTVEPLLAEVETDLAALPQVWDTWATEVSSSQDPIEETFNQAEAAFKEAAPDDGARDRVDVLFTASDAACTRGSV
jgi:hypothetical protein